MSRQKGAKDVRTMAGVIDARRSRSSHGALLEMSMLEMERQRLSSEADRLRHRCAEIAVRVGEIEQRQQRLQAFVDRPVRAVGESQPEAKPAAPATAVRSRRLTY